MSEKSEYKERKGVFKIAKVSSGYEVQWFKYAPTYDHTVATTTDANVADMIADALNRQRQ